jgi:hypothetical protein
VIGRVFTENEDEQGAKVVLISHRLWQRRYGGSPDVLRRKIAMNTSDRRSGSPAAIVNETFVTATSRAGFTLL